MGKPERAERAIVVSLHKSGTNLVTRLFKAMGYTPIGAGVNESYDAILRKLGEHRRSPRYQRFLGDEHAILADPAALLELCFGGFGSDTAVFLHGLDASTDLSEAPAFGDTPIVFNYRDPRAVLVSFVHYLTSGAREEFTRISGYVELSEMLERLSGPEERLAFVMKYVPNYLNGAFLGNAWLLEHPRVLCVSYEALVGGRGGGSEERQLAAVAGLMDHLGVAADARDVAARLYDTGSRTFRKGSVESWRDEFTPQLTQTFEAKYGEILRTYGYPA